ncbi:hypothetical protein SBP_00057 [Klebsiella phage SBP]|uniref:Uncharacterized protein n=1 Tax=Klebsiella phage SBP TaxID=2973661 RepID=A0A9X9JTZ3_9CAUD|nr:hypothetical protein PQZ68_gp57 [Klebsiella phage SBP]UYE94809.1 hypothetical protein SBP_00057 [Klebsiella phage SBP]
MGKRELTYGNNAMYFLYELSQYESGSEDFLNGEFEVYGEDEQGRDGSATIDIVELATDVYQIDSELLEALQDLQARACIYVNTSKAEAAIAKATGETK